MDDDRVQIDLSAAEFGKSKQFFQHIQVALSGAQTGYQPLGPPVTVDERCHYRWPLATSEHRRRIRAVFAAKYRERRGHHPLKLTGHPNGALVCEREYVVILDRALDTVRHEAEARAMMPLCGRRIR